MLAVNCVMKARQGGGPVATINVPAVALKLARRRQRRKSRRSSSRRSWKTMNRSTAPRSCPKTRQDASSSPAADSVAKVEDSDDSDEDASSNSVSALT